MFYFTMLGSQIDLCFWNRLSNYFASAREAYKSLACRNLWPDTGQHRSSANISISRLKQRQKSQTVFLSLGQMVDLVRLRKETETEVAEYWATYCPFFVYMYVYAC